MGKVFRPRIVIPESFDLCLTYEQQILYLARWCGMLADAIGGPGFVDSEVTEGSKKPVESGAVKAYVDAEIAKLRGGN